VVIPVCPLHPIIEVVGSRNASTNGRRFAELLSLDLGKTDVIVVSSRSVALTPRATRARIRQAPLTSWRAVPKLSIHKDNVGLHESIFKYWLVVSEQQPDVEPIAR